MQNESHSDQIWNQSKIPWVVFGVALVVYLATLNHWISLSSLGVTANVVGWDWMGTNQAPLDYLLTWPIRLLPEAWQPLALNGMAATLAAFTLAILARSIMLLPHDRTREQRQRERSEHAFLNFRMAWIPAAAAGFMLGFQSTFWEHATSGTGEMLKLLLFAWLIQHLLQYRVERRPALLFRFAFLYAAAITNNWAMIGFAPLFLVALVWIAGLELLRKETLIPMILCVAGGLLFYLVIPLVATAKGTTESSFWFNIKQEIVQAVRVFVSFPRGNALLLSLSSILPLFLIGIRWPSSFGDVSALGGLLSGAMFRFIHALLLILCIWVMFDPKYSPKSLGYGLPMLTFYYLMAISIGYFLGYFLLLGSVPAGRHGRPRSTRSGDPIGPVIQALVWLISLGVPAALAVKNFPQVKAINGPVLKDYARMLRESLPDSKAVVLSDNRYELMLLNAMASEDEATGQHIFIETEFLPYQVYLKYLRQKFPEVITIREEIAGIPSPLGHVAQKELLTDIAKNTEVYYLHPSFGFFYESFYPQPNRLMQHLVAYKADDILPPQLDEDSIEELIQLSAELPSRLTPLVELVASESKDALVLGRWMARRLNYLGVILQQAKRLPEAATYFDLAMKANPENAAAEINQTYNRALQSGNSSSIEISEQAKLMIETYRDWDSMIADTGPIDEPDFCFGLANIYWRGGNTRQALIQYQRTFELNPQNQEACLQLANIYLLLKQTDQVDAFLAKIDAAKETNPLQRDQIIALERLRGLNAFAQGNFARAEAILRQAESDFPGNSGVLESLFYIYHQSERPEQALELTKKQLQVKPDLKKPLIYQSAIYIQLKEFEKALVPLNRVLELHPDDTFALINRAIAHLQGGQLDAAEEDYKHLQTLLPETEMHRVYYGLGEIAYRRGDSTVALENFERFTEIAVPENKELEGVRAKIAELRNAP